MKKIFRMALVFALAGATLMYTSCTKDYQEEINKLDNKIESLSNDLSTFEQRAADLERSIASLDAAYKAADKAFDGSLSTLTTDVSGLKTKVGAIEAAIKDLDKLATKDEVSAAKADLEKKITDDLAALKAEILEKTDDLAKQLADLKVELEKKANAEDVEIRLKALEEAQSSIDDVYGFLSDELRSIVFLPDFYFAGIEATSYDFGSFIGYLVYGNPYADYTFYADKDGNKLAPPAQGQQAPEGSIKYVIKKGAKYLADLYYNTDAKGNAMWYKYDPETYEWIYKDGKLVAGKEGDENVRRFFPANYLQGQVGKASYNLNPSSFPVDSAEWSLNGRNVKYVLKAEEEVTWSPVFVGISSDGAGLATVEYSIDNPDKIYSSILGAVIDCAIGLYNKYGENEEGIEDIIETFNIDELLGRGKQLKANTNMNWMEQAQNELLAKTYRYNNVPTMQLVGTLGDGRQIFSDWHAISSSEEVVGHLAFDASNPYVTEWGDCGINFGEVEKDLYTVSDWAVIDPASVPVKWNGGPIDLAELIAIHTFDGLSYQPLAEYTLAEFNEKYPGYHFEFEMVPYTIGANATSEDMYGKLDGSQFTPCYVESAGGKATSKPIAKDSEDGISAVGRQPVVLVTLVNDETKNIQAYGWFKLVISKDAKLPQFFEIPDLGKVPFICSNYTLATKWHEFSFFVLEALKVDYNAFINSYQFDGVYVYANVLQADGTTVKKDLVATDVKTEGSFQDVKFKDYNKDKKVYEDKNWGKAQYKKDASGDGINDAFSWQVNPQKVGEGKAQSIYFKFHNGDSIVYFEMKADVAKKAKMFFAENKTNNLWFPDIDEEPMNTVRISVPVPDNTKGLTVMDFYKNLFEFFNGNPGMPVLGLVAEESDPIYASIYNNPRSPYRSELTTTKSVFQFSKTQPLIATAADLGYDTQLFVKSWKDDGTPEDYTKLYAVKYYFNMNKWAYDPIMDEISDGKGGYTYHYHIFEDQLVATITPGEEVGYVIEYANTEVAKYLLNLWSYKTDKQENMLYANITAKNKYGSTACVSVDDGNFHVRFIRPIDIDFAAQDVAEESQVDGANISVINFFEGITDWNNQPVVRKHMVDVKDKNGKVTGQKWDGTYEEVVIKTINMYKYYQFDKIRINVGGALRNNWDSKDPAKWGVMAEQTPAHMLFLGSVDEATGKFTETTETPIVSPDPAAIPPVYDKIYEVSIADFNNLATYVLNYKNTQGYASKFTILVPIEIDYAWGTLADYMVINIKETSETEPGTK